MHNDCLKKRKKDAEAKVGQAKIVVKPTKYMFDQALLVGIILHQALFGLEM